MLRGNVTSKNRTMPKRNKVMKRSAPGVLLVLLVLTASWILAATVPFRIQMESWSPYFAPVAATVTAGSPVRWENPTGTHHTITHDGCRGTGACAFDSGAIGPDSVFELSGLPPGLYPYHCTLHPIMRGTLVVVDAQHASKI